MAAEILQEAIETPQQRLIRVGLIPDRQNSLEGKISAALRNVTSFFGSDCPSGTALKKILETYIAPMPQFVKLKSLNPTGVRLRLLDPQDQIAYAAALVKYLPTANAADTPPEERTSPYTVVFTDIDTGFKATLFGPRLAGRPRAIQMTIENQRATEVEFIPSW